MPKSETCAMADTSHMIGEGKLCAILRIQFYKKKCALNWAIAHDLGYKSYVRSRAHTSNEKKRLRWIELSLTIEEWKFCTISCTHFHWKKHTGCSELSHTFCLREPSVPPLLENRSQPSSTVLLRSIQDAPHPLFPPCRCAWIDMVGSFSCI